MTNPLVSICCITYNHAAYISKCIEGFLMQKTSFPFEIIINDDCSTDGTTEILKKYAENNPKLIRLVLHNENQYSKGIKCILASFVYPLARGKYIALCEGDDYWIDQYKLQKQVDFLESHPDYGMVYTNYKMFFQENGETTVSNCIQTSFEDEIIRNRIATLTTLVSNALLKQYIQEIGNTPYERNWLMGDYPTWIYIIANSKVKLIPDVTAVYRVLKNSASHHSSYKKNKEFLISTYDICFYFSDKYNVSTEIRKTIANNEINDLLYLTKKHKTNLHFPLLRFMMRNKIFGIKKYLSAKLRSYVFGRIIYNHIKAI